MYIIRRDIQSFYETLPIAAVKEHVLYGTFIPTRIKEFLKMYFATFSPNLTGVPRGMGLSSAIAELAMGKTDQKIRELPGVYKYFRYSDDILIFSTIQPEKIDASLAGTLPPGMKFNPEKSSEIEIHESRRNAARILVLDYLGYKFSFSNAIGDKSPRKVVVEISDRKVKKLKSKIICVFKSFSKNKDFSLFRDRIAFLASNYFAYRKGVSMVRDSPYAKSGIYYNYHLCGTYQGEARMPHECRELKSLDGFFNSLMRSNSSSFRPLFTGVAGNYRLKTMERISFFKGYQKKMMVRFNSDKVSKIKSAWRNA